MKRSKSLVELSREHHLSLVLAQRAQRMGSASAEQAESFVKEAIANFAQDLELHFRLEEDVLLPALKRAGQVELVTRTLVEHAHLRRLSGELSARDAATMQRFGDMLNAHVRFEERELFPVAETVLSPETLAAIERQVQEYAASRRQ